MGKMQVKDLVPGMITTEPVKTQRGQLIINEGVPLTRQLIARMEFYGIAEASVVVVQTEPTEPVKAAPPSASPVPPAEKLAVLAPELTYSQKIRKSFSFQKFQVDYTNHVHKFYDYLKDFKETGTLHYADELVAIPKTLMQETRTSIQFFDMLHNLRQIDDSVYAHSLNVAMISRMLGRWLKLPSEELDTLTLAGALHDVGKFLIPEEVLNKEGKLTDEVISLIMQEEKPNQIEKIRLSSQRISRFFAPRTSVKEMENEIVKALEVYQRYKKRQREKQER